MTTESFTGGIAGGEIPNRNSIDRLTEKPRGSHHLAEEHWGAEQMTISFVVPGKELDGGMHADESPEEKALRQLFEEQERKKIPSTKKNEGRTSQITWYVQLKNKMEGQKEEIAIVAKVTTKTIGKTEVGNPPIHILELRDLFFHTQETPMEQRSGLQYTQAVHLAVFLETILETIGDGEVLFLHLDSQTKRIFYELTRIGETYSFFQKDFNITEIGKSGNEYFMIRATDTRNRKQEASTYFRNIKEACIRPIENMTEESTDDASNSIHIFEEDLTPYLFKGDRRGVEKRGVEAEIDTELALLNCIDNPETEACGAVRMENRFHASRRLFNKNTFLDGHIIVPKKEMHKEELEGRNRKDIDAAEKARIAAYVEKMGWETEKSEMRAIEEDLLAGNPFLVVSEVRQTQEKKRIIIGVSRLVPIETSPMREALDAHDFRGILLEEGSFEVSRFAPAEIDGTKNPKQNLRAVVAILDAMVHFCTAPQVVGKRPKTFFYADVTEETLGKIHQQLERALKRAYRKKRGDSDELAIPNYRSPLTESELMAKTAG